MFQRLILLSVASCTFVSREKTDFDAIPPNRYLRSPKSNESVIDEGNEGSGSIDPMKTTLDPKSNSFTTHIPDEILKRITDQPGVNSAIDAILVLVVIQTMLGLGCTMDINLIKEHLYQPSGKFHF